MAHQLAGFWQTSCPLNLLFHLVQGLNVCKQHQSCHKLPHHLAWRHCSCTECDQSKDHEFLPALLDLAASPMGCHSGKGCQRHLLCIQVHSREQEEGSKQKSKAGHLPGAGRQPQATSACSRQPAASGRTPGAAPRPRTRATASMLSGQRLSAWQDRGRSTSRRRNMTLATSKRGAVARRRTREQLHHQPPQVDV